MRPSPHRKREIIQGANDAKINGRPMPANARAVSLAFLAPEIVKAAVEGRLPRGFGLKRLVDLPMAWPDQWRTLGLQKPAQA
jgi:site-specific DNA recombinase